MQRLAPRGYLDGYALLLKVGERLDQEPFRQRLEAAGCVCVSQVVERGRVRGARRDPRSVSDGRRATRTGSNYSTTRWKASAISTRTPNSVTKVEHAELLPARGFPLDKETVTRFRQAYRRQFEATRSAAIYREVSADHAPGGIEYYLPCFRTDRHAVRLSAGKYPGDPTGGRGSGADGIPGPAHGRYEQRRHDAERPLLPPPLLFLDAAQVEARWHAARGSELRKRKTPKSTTRPNRRRRYRSSRAPRNLAPRCKPSWRRFRDGCWWPPNPLVGAGAAGRCGHGLQATVCEGWTEFLAREDLRLAVAVAPLEQGLLLTEPPLAVIAEPQLYGERVRQRRRHGPVATRHHHSQSHRSRSRCARGARGAQDRPLRRTGTAGSSRHRWRVRGGGIRRRRSSVRTGGIPASAQPLHRRRAENAPTAQAGQRPVGKSPAQGRRTGQRRGGGAVGSGTLAARPDPAMPLPCPKPITPPSPPPSRSRETLDQQGRHRGGDRRPALGPAHGSGGLRRRRFRQDRGCDARRLRGGAGRADRWRCWPRRRCWPSSTIRIFLDRFADWPVRIELLSRFRSAKQQTETLKALADGGADILIGTPAVAGQREIQTVGAGRHR